MQRRTFLQNTLGASAGAAALAAMGSPAFAQSDVPADRHYYEWRTYRLPAADKQDAVKGYLKDAVLPVYKELEIGPIGVFTEIGDEPSADVHALFTYPSIAALGDARRKMEASSVYQETAADYLKTDRNNKRFDSIESWLYAAFDADPHIAPPKDRGYVFEVRIYNNPNEERARAKVDMFNAGEAAIFRDAGFDTVFFGEALLGSNLPHLRYMLAAADMEANRAGWGKFMQSPDWRPLSRDPKYANTVSSFSNKFLEPTDFSEI